jgi:hypothetical protein
VLDRVGHVDLAAVDARHLEPAVELAARRSYERSSVAVLAVARLLAHQHQPGAGPALSEHRLLGGLVQMASAAPLRGGAQRVQGRRARRHVVPGIAHAKPS